MDNDVVAPYESARRHSVLLSEQGKNGSRSSKRTDILNDELISRVLVPLANNNWSFVPEYKIDCPRGGTFKVDVAGFYKNELRCIFLLKAVEASYNKNSHNYANTCEGEAGRIFDHPERGDNLSLFTVDWIPNVVRAPTPKNKLRTESTKVPNMDLSEQRWNTHLQSRYTNAHVAFCKIRFDYDNLVGATNVDGATKLLEGLRRVFQ